MIVDYSVWVWGIQGAIVSQFHVYRLTHYSAMNYGFIIISMKSAVKQN